MQAQVILRGAALVLAGVLVCARVSAGPAAAASNGDLDAHCTESNAQCTVSVTSHQVPKTQNHATEHGAPKPSPSDLLQQWLASCRVHYDPAAAGAKVRPKTSGSWYLAPCASVLGVNGQMPAGAPLMFVPNAPKPASALQAAQRAEAMLRLPPPAIAPGAW